MLKNDRCKLFIMEMRKAVTSQLKAACKTMIRFIIFFLFFSSSLLTVFRAPTNLLWYVSILVTEFCWVFIVLVAMLLFWKNGTSFYQLLGTITGLAAILLFSLPII